MAISTFFYVYPDQGKNSPYYGNIIGSKVPNFLIFNKVWGA